MNIYYGESDYNWIIDIICELQDENKINEKEFSNLYSSLMYINGINIHQWEFLYGDSILW